MADPDRLDERFRDPDGTPDDEQIRRFCTAAEALGLSVMTDLVIGKPVEEAMAVHEVFLTLMQGKGTVEPDEDVLEDTSDLEDDADVIGGDIEVESETDEKDL